MEKPTKEILDEIDMEGIVSNIDENDTNLVYLPMKAGQEHYRLLVWLGMNVKGKIVELGSFRGHSALCLAKGGQEVISFDIENHLTVKETPKNLRFVLDENGYLSIDESVGLVFIDTFHDGDYEREVLNYLRAINWKGAVLMDDIILFEGLRKLWGEIEETKFDWTDIGHHSGTGLILFE